MIASIKITDLSDAVSASFKDIKQNAWVSAVDEEDKNKIRTIRKNFSRRYIPYFAQFFYDWSDEDSESYIQRNIEEEGPKEQHINNIISFLENLVNSKQIYHLGINCFAGVSRSTAIGIIAWVLQGKAPKEALQEIIKVRYQAWPNLRMLRFASKRLNQDLVTPVKEWKYEQNGKIATPNGGWV